MIGVFLVPFVALVGGVIVVRLCCFDTKKVTLDICGLPYSESD